MEAAIFSRTDIRIRRCNDHTRGTCIGNSSGPASFTPASFTPASYAISKHTRNKQHRDSRDKRQSPQNDVNGITGTAAPSTVGPGIITVNPSGSSTGVQSGSTGSVGNVLRAPLLAPLRTERPAIRVR